uniref:BTB domain-containing protein n=1 Tax=Capitella teleta TaxID=283909 RepID=X2BA40_CAPTE
MDDMRTASEFVDIVLVFGKVRLPCHKVVLASNCEYFKRMFLAGMKESQTDEVVMNGIDCKTGVLIVKYLYSGSITVTEENAQDLLSASNMFLLSDLKDSIEKFLSKRIQPPNCVSLLNLSHFFELQDLIKTSRKFIADKWDDLSDESIVELTEDDMEVILKEHECQENNFLRLQSWVKSVDGGEERFPRLLENVKL